MTKKQLVTQQDHKNLLTWYQQNLRPLPWRKNHDPYRIWISEVMLQQTTVAAVIPFFEKFMLNFPNVESLANASIEQVYELWSGLGYYSRARNIHKASQQIVTNGFPKTFSELIQLPGFGPYTARAVSSIAHNEPVGVLDGNVIRILTRRYGLKIQWWKNSARNELQEIADQLAQLGEPRHLNQAMMELGATVCTPQNPLCSLCPWKKNCVAFGENLQTQLPLPKPRKQLEPWIWNIDLCRDQNKILLIENNYAPFLKKQKIFPGTIQKSKSTPTDYDLKHTITHHNIFIRIHNKTKLKLTNPIWVSVDEIKKINPSIILSKVLQHEKKPSKSKSK